MAMGGESREMAMKRRSKEVRKWWTILKEWGLVQFGQKIRVNEKGLCPVLHAEHGGLDELIEERTEAIGLEQNLKKKRCRDRGDN